jgi:hypothetical protein
MGDMKNLHKIVMSRSEGMGDKILLTFMLRAVLSGYGMNKFPEIRIRK